MSLFLAGRTLRAVLLVFVVSSAALLLVHLAPAIPSTGPGCLRGTQRLNARVWG